MSSEKEHDRHEQAAYEAAIRLKREREVQGEVAKYKRALEEIANRATYERNPDGEDQAAATMQLIAREALNEGCIE